MRTVERVGRVLTRRKLSHVSAMRTPPHSATFSHSLSAQNGEREASVGAYDLDMIKDSLKAEIRRELKIKEGAENLAKVAKDKRSRSEVSSILKQSNHKLQELHKQLNEVNAQVSDTGKKSRRKRLDSLRGACTRK